MEDQLVAFVTIIRFVKRVTRRTPLVVEGLPTIQVWSVRLNR